ncbi:MAG: ABC transporter permease [Gemmatimonadetes bacterium]|nr:ABC transporter permease [Gemmatimonadota bacterium]
MGSRRFRRWLRIPGRRREDLDQELEEEIEAHLALRIDDLVRSGMSPADARAEALRRFGDVASARARLRASARSKERRLRHHDIVDSVRSDLRTGLRQMARSPGFTAVALLTFTLGIGLTTLMFTIVDHVLLRPLPFPGADRLVALQSVDSLGNEFPYVSIGNWVDWQERGRTLESSALIHVSVSSATVVAGGEATRVGAALVAGPFFAVLRPRFVAGRGFTVDEMQAREAVVVVSEGFWRSRLGSPPVLPDLNVDGRDVRIVGVIARGFGYPESAEIWRGQAWAPETGALRNNVNYYAIGRIAPGATMATARAELSSIARRIRESDPAGLYSWAVGVNALHDEVTGGASDSLLLLLAGVAVVLLIACANLAGLGLARSAARQADIAMRMALGAGRRRILRQLITEGLVLAVVGGALGVAAAQWGMRAIALRLGAALPRTGVISIDLRILAVAALVTILAGVLASALPALRTSRLPMRTLLGAGRGSVRGGRNLPGAALVGCEFALAMLLLTAGALLVRSYTTVLSRELGFDEQGVITAEVVLTAPAYAGRDNEPRAAYWRNLLDRMRATPGVQRAAVANWVPGGIGGSTFVDIEGAESANTGAQYRVVSDEYFATIGIAVLAGRAFEPADARDGERVAIVNRSFADRYLEGGNALGRRIRAPSQERYLGSPWLRVVGIVADIRHWGHESDTQPELYVLQRQVPTYDVALTLLVRGDPRSLGSLQETVRTIIHETDPAIAAIIEPLETRVARTLAQRRLTMVVLTVFSVLALSLAAIGLYGLISFAVSRRTREIGVRAALGARRLRIVRMMVGNALGVVAVGAAAGLLASWWLARLLRGLLFDVQPLDPLAWSAALAVMLTVSMIAAWIPAWRAARIDPLDALRRS